MSEAPGLEFCVALSFSPLDQFVPLAKAADEPGWHAVGALRPRRQPRGDRVRRTRTPRTDGRRWEPFTPWADPWVAIGAMAGSTTNLRFFTNVYVLPMRPPIAVAKAVGTAAVISGNRVALGVGMGWMEEEFRLLEQPFARRGKRADEMLEVLAKLWAGGWVEHHGEFYDFDRLEMSPAPTERIPIYVGGMSEPALRRAARHDGWISDLHTIDELREITDEAAPLPRGARQGRRAVRRRRLDPARPSTSTATGGSPTPASPTCSRCRGCSTAASPTTSTARIDGIHRFADDIIARY